LLNPTKTRFSKVDVPWVIENVVGAGTEMKGAVKLHGGMFGLRVHRPRLFLSNVPLLTYYAPVTKQPVGVYDDRPRGKIHMRTRTCMKTGKKSEMRIARTLEEAQEAMGMDWADWHGTKEAVPPAYSEYIGRQIAEYLR
jgi:DNA (cytosine-5)-methyltransferase 1